MTDISFNNFAATTAGSCAQRQSAIARNKYASDYIPIHSFVNTVFNDVDEDAVAYIKDPDPAWANPTDCIEWPCTGPENAVLMFTGASFTGTTPTETDAEFQIVSDAEGAVNAYTSCVLKTAWSAGRCQNNKLGVLLFESLDSDTEDRTIQPVNITSE